MALAARFPARRLSQWVWLTADQLQIMHDIEAVELLVIIVAG